ncbi:MAG: VWA domain-containing protein [Acidobacteriia bacterium]|nr:VWA domain-containing protein [Terriglobia bacterium]
MLTRAHIRSLLLALFVLTYAVLTHAAAAEKTNDSSNLPTYRSVVSRVQVTFFVTDENNHPVETLTKSDFAVVDNGLVVRNFRSFSASDENSLDVVALVDLSESVAPGTRVAIQDVQELVAQEQSIRDDSVAVLYFGAFGGTSGRVRPTVLCSGGGCRSANSVNTLLAVKGGGTTPMFDALIVGADLIWHHRRTGVRPVLILFSDGNDTTSLHSEGEALDAVVAAGALVYAVDMGKATNPPAGSRFLRQVADASGGRYFSLQDGIANVMSAGFEDLRASYVVTYDLPSHRAGFHSLRLMPTHTLNLTFHSRNRYYYEPDLR